MKRNLAISFLILLVAGLASALPAWAQAVKQAEKKVQVVKLSFDDNGYVVTPPTVVKGIPVRMEVDLQTVKGCMRTVVIDAVNVKKTVKAGDTTIEFTPAKSGPVGIVCGMNMGKGSFKVVEPGTK
jgi:plastocyanin domain-containing protein